MNVIAMIGRLTADPEVRYTTSDKPMAIGRFTLAVDRDFKKEGEPTADFIRCVAFSKQGEFCEKYLKKGTKIGITGRIQTGSYDDKDGKKVYTTEVIVSNYTFCENKGASDNVVSLPPAQKQDFMQIPDGWESELPFV